jgi:hypothetical protein
LSSLAEAVTIRLVPGSNLAGILTNLIEGLRFLFIPTEQILD